MWGSGQAVMERWAREHPVSPYVGADRDRYPSGDLSPGKLGEDTLAREVGERNELVCQSNRDKGVALCMTTGLSDELENNVKIGEV